MLVQSVVNSFGSQMLAGYSAAMRIESVCIVPMSAMGNAISLTRPKIWRGPAGAGQGRLPGQLRHRVRHRGGALPGGAAAGPAAISLFMEDGGSAVAFETGMACTRFMGWFYVLIGLKMISDGVLRGAGT